MGIQAQNGNYGIYGKNSGTAEIHHNILTGNAEGIKLECNDKSSMSAVITNNRIINSTANGIELLSYNFSSLSCSFSDNTISNNTGAGIFHVAGSTAPSADTSTITAVFLRDVITDNTNGTVFRAGWSTAISGSFSYTTIADNSDDGILLDNLGAGTKIVDAGNGSLGSRGNNSIYGNGDYNINNQTADTASPQTVTAENNWWGSKTPYTSRFHGAVDYTPWLTSDPN